MPGPAEGSLPAAENSPASSQSWLSELSAPDPLARWASSFTDLRSCWNACRNPEWLLWLAARTRDSAEQQKQVVLCIAELAAEAQRRERETDPRVTQAISVLQLWGESAADAIDLLAAEHDALDAARECSQTADRAAESAIALFRAAPRRRPSSFGTNRAFGAWRRWREQERGSWLALAAASAASATALPGDATVSANEWADGVSQAAAFALRAMSTPRPSGGRPSRAAARRCVRLAKRRLGGLMAEAGAQP